MEEILSKIPVIIEALYLIISGISLYVGLTDSKEDDKVVAKLLERISYLRRRNADGTLKLPFRK